MTVALIHQRTADHKKALADLVTATRLGTRRPTVRWACVMTMITIGGTQKAREVVTSCLWSSQDRDSTYICWVLLAMVDLYERKVSSARSDLSQAIASDPKKDAAYVIRATLNLENSPRAAFDDIDMAIRVNPDNPASYRLRAALHKGRGEYGPAVADLEQAIRKNPKDAEAHAGRAVLLATCPDAKLRDGKEAIAAATRACELSQWKTDWYVASLAAACATSGDFRAAVAYQQRAIGLLAKDDSKAGDYRKLLARYKADKPYYKLGILEEWGLRRAMRRAN